MALYSPVSERQPFRCQNFSIDKRQSLGHGAYGAVYKAKCDQLPCAAKILHPTLLDPTDPGVERVMQRFQLECSVLERIRHPNIVQYLGLYRDPESGLPVLLMELLDESLTTMLQSSQRPLAYFVEVNICHDIALAVAYLHSNGIIHRDLSSNNVLIIAKSRAKVTDFGMSKLAGAAPTKAPLTFCPGTQGFMAPEALVEPPTYTMKLDCFSEGVIMIQVCTRLWPEPGPLSKTVPFPESPTGVIQMPVLEPVRRKNHIDIINRDHPLLPIALDCLHYRERERPTSAELCQRLADLKENTKYRENVEQIEREQNDVATLERTVQQLLKNQRQKQIRKLKQQLEEQEELTAVFQRANNSLQCHMEQLQQQLIEVEKREAATVRQLHDEWQHKKDMTDEHERQIRWLKQQRVEQEQVTAKIQQAKNSLQRQTEQQMSQQIQSTTKPPPPQVALRTQLRGRELQVKPSQRSLVQKLHTSTKKLTITKWRDGGKEVPDMRRGDAVVDGNVAYFMNFYSQICSFNASTEEWIPLPKCPCQYSSLAVIRGLLTAIGGLSQGFSQNTLYSFVKDKAEWINSFPPMPTNRHSTAVVASKHHLIVAGGVRGWCILNAVEVLDIESLEWSTVASLPRQYTSASATICGGHLYLLGGYDCNRLISSVFTCSLSELLRSHDRTPPNLVWRNIADAPALGSTCAAVGGELVAVGGWNKAESNTTSAVYKYNMISKSWDVITKMPTSRYFCLVAILPTSEIVVVGGIKSFSHIAVGKSDVVEIAKLSHY